MCNSQLLNEPQALYRSKTEKKEHPLVGSGRGVWAVIKEVALKEVIKAIITFLMGDKARVCVLFAS